MENLLKMILQLDTVLVPHAQICLNSMYHIADTRNVSYRGDTYTPWNGFAYTVSFISFLEQCILIKVAGVEK